MSPQSLHWDNNAVVFRKRENLNGRINANFILYSRMCHFICNNDQPCIFLFAMQKYGVSSRNVKLCNKSFICQMKHFNLLCCQTQERLFSSVCEISVLEKEACVQIPLKTVFCFFEGMHLKLFQTSPCMRFLVKLWVFVTVISSDNMFLNVM